MKEELSGGRRGLRMADQKIFIFYYYFKRKERKGKEKKNGGCGTGNIKRNCFVICPRFLSLSKQEITCNRKSGIEARDLSFY